MSAITNAVDRFLVGHAGLGLTERAALLAASTAVGRTFSRGLLPRSTADQAVITGVATTLNYAAVVMVQSVVDSVAFKLAGDGGQTRQQRMAHRGLIMAADLVGLGVGLGAQRALPQRKGEPMARAWARTLSWRLAVGGAAGAVVTAADTLTEQASSTAPWARRVPIALPLGAALATANYHSLRRGMRAAGVSHDAQGMALEEAPAISVGRSVLIGAGVSAGLLTLAEGERAFAHGVARIVTAVNPRAEIIGKPVGHLAAAAILGAAGARGLQTVFHKAERGGDAVEAAYNEPPTSLYVSGGPNSAVSWTDVGREGRRFVNMALTREEIAEVMGGDPMDPIRVFVGLESGATASERADLAMRELEALGALQRKLIVFMSPTGTGYLNYVTAESLEYLTGGDVALVAMQYSLRPSPLSLGRVGIGVEQNNALLHALKWRLQAIPEPDRPRLCAFGESLGAQTAQDVFAEEGTGGLHRVGIERALFLGTPAATKWRQRWRSDPNVWDPRGEVVEVDSYAEFTALPEQVRSRSKFFLLTHHNDPMPKFWFPLAVQAPDWLGPAATREPGVPPEVSWRPYTTFIITLVDVKNAMHVIPGQFVAQGHDYRKDLARFTSLAFNLPIDDVRLERMERALRARELKWAELRLIDEQFAGAEASIKEQLGKWGVDPDKLPTLVSSPLPQGEDPFRAPLQPVP